MSTSVDPVALDALGNPLFPLVCESCGKDTGEIVGGGALPWTCSRACRLQWEYAESLKERTS